MAITRVIIITTYIVSSLSIIITSYFSENYKVVFSILLLFFILIFIFEPLPKEKYNSHALSATAIAISVASLLIGNALQEKRLQKLENSDVFMYIKTAKGKVPNKKYIDVLIKNANILDKNYYISILKEMAPQDLYLSELKKYDVELYIKEHNRINSELDAKRRADSISDMKIYPTKYISMDNFRYDIKMIGSLIVSFDLSNNSYIDYKDFNISCITYGSSGTAINEKTKLYTT